MSSTNDALFPNHPAEAGHARKTGKDARELDSSLNKVRLDTLRIPRASEMVADKLRNLIVSGQVLQGAGLPSEKELVAQLGVSRATLREALRLLEAEGLISTKPGPKGGIVVKHPGPAHLTRSLSLLLQLEEAPFSSLLEARRLLEPLCANLAAERATPEELAELATAVEELRASVGNTSRYVQEQLRFHLGIFAAAHNPVLRLYTTSIGELITTRAAQVGLSEAAQHTGIKAVEGILAAIVAKDGTLAARRVEAHLRAFDAVLLRNNTNRKIYE